MEKNWWINEDRFWKQTLFGDNDKYDKYMKTKIKIYAGSMITNFHNKKMPKEKYHMNVYQ